MSLLCNFVGLDGAISSLECFEAELLHVCLSSSIVDYGVVVCIFTLRLPNLLAFVDFMRL
jgi:hypothetical protein